MAAIRGNSMPLQSIRDVAMLRLSLQCLTLPAKKSNCLSKAFQTYGVNIH